MIYVFGDYALDPNRRELRRGAELIRVEPRVFDLLEYLIRNRDRVVGKDDLIETVWKGRIVSESALTSRLNAARHVIGDSGEKQRLIRTIARKGHRFVGEVREEQEQPHATVEHPARPVQPALALPDKPSIAILPLANLSGEPDQDYFADGMVEDIITGLSPTKWLFVIARNSSFIYKGRAIDVKQVGHELGVRYVLEGSVRRAGERVRINAQLVEAETGTHLWAERYDRLLDDIFALQDEITLNVVGAIEPSLRDAEIARVKRKRPDSLDAYDLVLQAHPDVYSRMPEHARTALVLLDRALALDPSYALAHAYAAQCHHCVYFRGGLDEKHRTASIRHAEAAIEHGQDDAVALTFAGFSIGMDRHDTAAAFAAFEAALAVSPSTALTYILGSVILAWAGQTERAIEWGEQGLRLSPFDPMRSSAFIGLSLGHFQRGDYEKAVAAARKAVQSSPGFSVCHEVLAASLVKLGRLEEAKSAAARLLELQPSYSHRQLAAVGCAPMLFASLSESLRAAGLPE